MTLQKYIIFSLLICSSLFSEGSDESMRSSSAASEGAIKHIRASESVIFSSNTSYYNPELIKKGVNGPVLLAGKVLKSGELIDLDVKESSHSQELDESAKRFITANFQRKERDYDVLVDFPVEFSRAYSVDDIVLTPCSELLKDLSYFRKNYPNKKLSSMRYMAALFGIMKVYNIQHDRLEEKISDDVAIEMVISNCPIDEEKTFFELAYRALYGF